MSTPETAKINTEPLDGDLATLLRTIQNTPSIDPTTLKKITEIHLLTNENYPSVFAAANERSLIKTSNIGISLTEEGQNWINDHNSELSVEAEDDSSDTIPKKPYDVAKLNMEQKQLSIFQVLRKIEKKEINLNPDFQRAFVWDDVRQSRLIESILIRIPLPAFYLDASNQTHWNVVDGLQRLSTMYRYCRGDSFKLIGLQFLKELEGKVFEDLPAQYKVLIEDDTQLMFYNLMPGTPIEAKFTIFSRVNTGGMQLTAQEIRHALNQGKATQLLQEIANHPDFRRITNGVVETLRMSDRELILRVLAFMHLGIKKYAEYGSLDAFMLAAMAELNKQAPETLNKLKSEFLSSLNKVHSLFGKYAFRKFYAIHGRRSPFNKALFEVWTTAVRDYSPETLTSNKQSIIKAFISLINDSEEFSRSISSSTGGSAAVATRFNRIKKLLSEACDD